MDDAARIIVGTMAITVSVALGIVALVALVAGFIAATEYGPPKIDVAWRRLFVGVACVVGMGLPISIAVIALRGIA